MKKQLIAILTIMLLVLGVTFSVNAIDAENATANLKASSTELNPGETFTVTFEATCEKGINGVTTTISYDEDKLELVKGVTVTDTAKWIRLEGETDLSADILCNSKDKITTGDIFTVTFKVKENARSRYKS